MSSLIANGADENVWLWKWPGPIAADSAIQCEAGEVAVLFEFGATKDVFEVGTRTIEKPGEYELLFLRTAPTIRFGTQVVTRAGRMRCFGELRLRVTDPTKVCGGVIGMADANVGDALSKLLSTRITKELSERLAVASLSADTVVQAIHDANAEFRAGKLGIDKSGVRGITGDSIVSINLTGPDGRDLAAGYQSAASGPTPGTAVSAYWTDGTWHPAKVLQVAGDKVQIQWDVGSATGWLPLDHVKPVS